MEDVEVRTVTVTQTHFECGVSESASRCPIALAVKECLKNDPLSFLPNLWHVEVHDYGVVIENEIGKAVTLPCGKRVAWKLAGHSDLPHAGKMFLWEFDDGTIEWEEDSTLDLELHFTRIKPYTLKG